MMHACVLFQLFNFVSKLQQVGCEAEIAPTWQKYWNFKTYSPTSFLYQFTVHLNPFARESYRSLKIEYNRGLA